MTTRFKRARESEWDNTTVGRALLAHICPLCCAHVPVGNDFHGVSYREQHVRWHEEGGQ